MFPVHQVWPKPFCKHSEMGMKTRQTEEEVGRQHQFGKSQRAVENREKWRKLAAKSSLVPQGPSRLRDRWWWCGRRRFWIWFFMLTPGTLLAGLGLESQGCSRSKTQRITSTVCAYHTLHLNCKTLQSFSSISSLWSGSRRVVNFLWWSLQRSRENYFRNFGVSLRETNCQKKILPSKNIVSST